MAFFFCILSIQDGVALGYRVNERIVTEIVEDRTKDRGGTKDTSAREDEMPQKTRSPRGVRS